MHVEAPTLTSEELKRKLEELLDKSGEGDERFRRKLMALHGRCERQVLEVAGRQIAVVPVGNELELREALPDPHEDEDMALVLGYPAVEVPIDLAGRFRKRGRVVRIAKLERLRQVFTGEGPSFVELADSLIDSALARHLLGLELAKPLRSPSGYIGLEQATMLWLREVWGVPESLALDNLLVFAATNTRHEAFAATMRRADAAGLGSEVLGVLAREVGPEAPLVWRTWLAGKGRKLLEFTLLFEALAAEPSEIASSSILSSARYELDIDETTIDVARQALASAAATAVDLHASQSSFEARQLLVAAESYVPERLRPHLRGSRRLPCAWAARLDELGQALQRAAEQPSEAHHAEVVAALRKLELHEAIELDENRVLVERAEMARRLSAWLVVRSDRKPPRQRATRFEALASWYASEGGYIDLARRRARPAASGTSSFAKGVSAVLAAVDALRIQQDREFAQGLSRWLEDGARRVLSIDKVIERFGTDFLRGQGGARRGLLVLVLDGMAWSQAVELLGDLSSPTTAVPWHPFSYNRALLGLEQASIVPVLAALPTDTHVSRSALLSGKRAEAGVEPRTGDDGKRWAEHPSLASLFTGVRKPILLLGNEAFGPEGVRLATRTAIAEREQPVVAIIVNTIDDALKSNVDDDAAWSLDRVAPLRELFEAARRAGRAVLLCSDHGNVSGQRLEYVNFGAGGKARWRPLFADTKLHEFEVAIESPPGWRPSDASSKGVVMICDDAHSYAGKRNHGEHGGATLAEVVAPTLLLGTEELTLGELGEPSVDPLLVLEPFGPPPWWFDDVREMATPQESVDERVPSKPAAEPAPEVQLPLLAMPGDDALRAEAVRRVAEVGEKSRAQGKKVHVQGKATESLLDRLEANALFKARTAHSEPGQPNLQQEVVAALVYLLERGDKSGDEAFAVALGKQKNRVAGLVSTLQQVLNVDGYDVLAHDVRGKQVRLDRELLVQGFGL